MIGTNTRHVVGEFPMDTNLFYQTMKDAYDTLYMRAGKGKEMTDWLDWPAKYLESEEYKRLKDTAKKIRSTSDAVIVVGIGGSYLTPQMIIHSEYGQFYNEVAEKKGLPRIYFLGCDLSPDKLNQTLEMVADCNWSVIYISKSGGTIEPALAYRVLWNRLSEKYGEADANNRVYAITDAQKGILKSMADKYGWESFVIPDGIGGRYSGLTAVGLLPVAVAGIDTNEILKGAITAMDESEDYNSFAAQYALWRFCNYFKGQRKVELYAVNSPYLAFCSEWLKQLFGESEGKEGKGVFPDSVTFPTDLHSLGQYLQEGERNLIFETFIIREFKDDIDIPSSTLDDQLDVYVGKKFSQAASAAMQGAYKAHSAGGNPCGIITIGNTLADIGYFMQSMFVACAVSAYMIKVNPFDQPGVEFHKKEMKKALLEE